MRLPSVCFCCPLVILLLFLFSPVGGKTGTATGAGIGDDAPLEWQVVPLPPPPKKTSVPLRLVCEAAVAMHDVEGSTTTGQSHSGGTNSLGYSSDVCGNVAGIDGYTCSQNCRWYVWPRRPYPFPFPILLFTFVHCSLLFFHSASVRLSIYPDAFLSCTGSTHGTPADRGWNVLCQHIVTQRGQCDARTS